MASHNQSVTPSISEIINQQFLVLTSKPVHESINQSVSLIQVVQDWHHSFTHSLELLIKQSIIRSCHSVTESLIHVVSQANKQSRSQTLFSSC